jgi:hypothetical protein
MDDSITQLENILTDLDRSNALKEVEIKALRQAVADLRSIAETQGDITNDLYKAQEEALKIYQKQLEFQVKLQRDRDTWRSITFVGIPVMTVAGLLVGMFAFPGR